MRRSNDLRRGDDLADDLRRGAPSAELIRDALLAGVWALSDRQSAELAAALDSGTDPSAVARRAAALAAE